MAADADVTSEQAASSAQPEDDRLKVVQADERVFRRVRYGKNEYSLSDGRLRVSSTAFSESTGKPSVDREVVRKGDPAPTQDGDPKNAVLILAVAEVRALERLFQSDKKGQPIGEGHAFDVFPDPLPEQDGKPANPSHAEIRPVPNFPEAGLRRLREKLQTSLARIANESLDPDGRWAIPVWELREARPQTPPKE